MESPDNDDPQARLCAALRAQVLISFGFTVVFIVVDLMWHNSHTLGAVTALNATYTCLLAVARRLAQRGRVSGAAALHAYATLLLGLVFAILVPSGWPVLLFAPIMAAAGCLPYLYDARLLRLLGASVGSAMTIGAIGMFSPARDDVPTDVKLGIMCLAIGSSTAIIMHLLWQFTSRSRLNIRTAEAARRIAEQAAADLRQAAQLREEFLTVASHELKTPVTAILLQVQGLVRSMSDSLTPSIFLGRLRKCEEITKRLVRLVDGLLDATRLTGEQFEPRRERLNLVALVHAACEQTLPSLGGQTLHVHPAEAEAIFGEWDKVALGRVFVSLMENAVKYGAGKPIEVTVRRLGVTAVEIGVCDHGIGVPVGDRKRIFEKFERAVSVRHYGGLGIGLWLSRRIIEAHGGTIDVESNVSSPGSKFVVRLPVPTVGPAHLVPKTGDAARWD